MAEIDYGTQFFVGTLRIENATETLRVAIEGAVLIFTALYVLWGGYKSAVYTDRFQVPVAYVAFSIFGFGAAVLTSQTAATNGAAYLIAVMTILFLVLLWRRYQLLKSTASDDTWDKLTAYLTFVPIILGGVSTIFYLWHSPGTWALTPLGSILFPQFDTLLQFHTLLGFGAWGTIALIFANGVWQFIDISSLQRLQSLDKSEVSSQREHVVKALRVTGIEAGIGWILIALTAALLKTTGLTLDKFGSDGFTNEAFGNLLHTLGGGGIGVLVPLFVFTVVVYMLSTISGFISAISYISFFDIVPSITGVEDERGDFKTTLHSARVTTVVVIAAIFLMYLLLRALMTISGNGGAIASVLYAIYAFQISIAPSAIVALFMKSIRVSPPAVVFSVAAGLIVAYLSAIDSQGWMHFASLGLDSASWAVIPPLASAFASTVTYAVVSIIAWLIPNAWNCISK